LSPLNIIRDPGFAKGVRVTVVNQDRKPAWLPDRMEEATAAEVERLLHFPPGTAELGLASTRTENTVMAAIGFIGLGNMGGPMAANLVKAGHRVSGYDLQPALLEAAAGTGVTPTTSAAAAVGEAEIVITMLPAGRHVTALYKETLVGAVRPGTLLIDSSTIDMAAAGEAHRLAAQNGLAALDAPVSGGVGGAAAGTLTFMCGGDAVAFARARPVLEAMGRKVLHCGAAGAGQAAKICNNMILGVSMIVVGEAFVLGERLGLAHQALYDVVSTSSGQCWSVTSYCPVPGPVPTSPANNGYKPGFAAALMLKDLRLAKEAAEMVNVDTALGRLAEAIYARFEETGHAGLDFSAIIQAVRAQSGGNREH
jgi:3-hydroxyisobutyrate dehydrogenase